MNRNEGQDVARLSILAAGTAGLALAMSGPSLATTYRFTDITPPGTASADIAQAFAISDNGKVVVSTATAGVSYGFTNYAGIYDVHNHTFTPTDPFPAATPNSTRPIGINNQGLIVGYYHPDGGYWQGYSDDKGTMGDLNAFGGYFNTPQGVTNNGDVVGAYGGVDSTLGYIYSKGVFTSVDAKPGEPAGLYSTGLVSINDSGAIIGNWGLSETADYPNSFLLYKGVFTPIAMAGFGRTAAESINASGVIVGGVTNDNFERGPAFVLDQGVYQEIRFPDALNTIAFGINASGWIVGRYTDAAGEVRAFLAIPNNAVPEPGAWSLMLVGVGLAGAILRRRTRETAQRA